MKIPHVHAALIKAWADGAEIEVQVLPDVPWELTHCPSWVPQFLYRIKPEPKPDVVSFFIANSFSFRAVDNWNHENLKLTFDGETGKLKSAEVI